MKEKIQTSIAYGQSKEIGIYALAAAVNEVLAAGADEVGVSVKILIPTFAYKSRINTMQKVIKEYCKKWQIHLLEMKSEKHAALKQSMVIVTANGSVEAEQSVTSGYDIVMTKWIGMEGMLRIISEKEEELRQRFSPSFITQMKSYKNMVFAEKEIQVARQNKTEILRQVGEGGILEALWNLSKETACGLEVDIKKLAVLQETIEVCEFFRINPYQLTSRGTMLMVTKDGEKLSERLNSQNIPAIIIGRLTDNNDKILYNGEEVRYIDRPAPDELMKIFEEQN